MRSSFIPTIDTTLVTTNVTTIVTTNVTTIVTTIVMVLALSGCASRPDCEPLSGFELGREAIPAEPACNAEGYAEAWRLGQTLGELESELRELTAQAAPTPAERQRIRVLQREIPELETLARLEGWLPPEHSRPRGP